MTRARHTALLVLALLLAGCGTRGGEPPVQRFPASDGVAVTVLVRAWDGNRGLLIVTLTPRRGFHLYSITFPAHGVDGVGQRTDVEFDGALRRTGPLGVAVPVHLLRVAGVRGLLAVYPPGPVHVVVHVRKAAGSGSTVILSYAACSATTCLPPVVNRRIRFRL